MRGVTTEATLSRSLAELLRLPLVAHVFLILLYSVGLSLGDTGFASLLALAGHLLTLITCLLTCARVLAWSREVVLTPLPWLFVAAGVYFGLGPLVHVLGPVELSGGASSGWVVRGHDLLVTGRLNAVGLSSLMGALMCVLPRGRATDVQPSPPVGSLQWTRRWMVAFLCVGWAVRVFVVLPRRFGMTSVPLPRSLTSAEGLAAVGLFLLARLASRERGFVTLLIVVLVANVGIGVASLSKASILVPIAVAGIGLYSGNGQRRVLAATGVVLFAVFVVSAPFVSQGRFALGSQEGRGRAVPLEKRIAILSDLATVTPTSRRESVRRTYGWWTRLSYVWPQAFVMRRYDAGIAGDTLATLPAVFVPRFLWPDKPVISREGPQFNRLVFGRTSSSTGIGIFGEAYWNGGWLLVVLVSSIVGLMIGVMSRLTLGWVWKQHYWMLPCVFLGMRLGFRLDGWIVLDYVGGGVMILSYALLLHVLLGRGAPRREFPARSGA